MRSSDPARLGALLEPHLDALFGAAVRLTGNRSDAEDLVQETCLRACTHLRHFDESKQPRGWLLRVQYHLFIDGARRAKRSPVCALDTSDNAALAAADSDPEGSLYREQLGDRLYRAWQALDREHRALLALRAEGYRLSELADITGLGKDVLTMRLYRARRRLARLLDEERPIARPARLEAAK